MRTDIPSLVRLSVPTKYAEGVMDLLKIAYTSDASVSLIRELAGKLSFAASMVPHLWAHTACLWAALAEVDSAIRSKCQANGRTYKEWLARAAQVPRQRIAHAIGWLILLFEDPKRLDREFHVGLHWKPATLQIQMDASPWGGGAVLLQNGHARSWLATKWARDDERNTGAVIGECMGQAVWEGLAMLIALRTWLGILKGERSVVQRGCVRTSQLKHPYGCFSTRHLLLSVVFEVRSLDDSISCVLFG